MSPEVKGLFNTVKKQAENYEKAYEMLTYNVKVFRDIITEANELVDDLKSEPARLSESMNEKIQNAVRVINHEQESLRKKYEFINDLAVIITEQEQRLNDINKFKSELAELRDQLSEKKNAVEILFKETKKSAEATIFRIVEDGKKLIEDEIESSAKQVENNIVLRQRQIEGKLIAYDEKYFNMTDHFKSDIRKLKGEIDMLTNLVKDLSSKSINHKVDSLEDISSINSEMKSKISELESRVDTITNTYRPSSDPKYSSGSDMKSSNPDIEKFLKPMRERLHSIDERLQDIEKRSSFGITMSWIAILAVIALIIFTVFSLS